MLNTELLPAQVFFLRYTKKLKIHDALSFVIRDLIIRKVVVYHTKSIFPNDRSRKTQKYNMLSKGLQFKGYEAQDFERNLISPLEEIDGVQIKTLTNFILRKYSMPSAYIGAQFLAPLRKIGYVNNIPIIKKFGVYSLTSKAKEITSDLDQIINQFEEKLSALIDGDKEQFYNTITELGSYVFIFEKKNPDLYKNIESMIRRIYTTKPLGVERDLYEYYQAMSIDLGFFHE